MTKFQVGDEVRVKGESRFGKKLNGIPLKISSFKTPVGEGWASVRETNELTNEYLVKIEQLREPKPTKNQRISALEKEVAELKKVVEGLQQFTEVEPAPTIDELIRMGRSVLPQSNNQKRATIIEKAKRFVEEHTTPNSIVVEWKKRGGVRIDAMGFVGIPYFTVKGRTVTIVFKGAGNGRILRKKVAICHPHDVFNEHIGKAIALGRALGLDVSEFEQAVQPDEVVVGMEVEILDHEKRSKSGDFRNVIGIKKGYPAFSNGMYASRYDITNDTNAQYEEVK